MAAGAFLMGDPDGAPCERPVHRVQVAAFAIARTPVTNAQYARYLAATGAPSPAFWRQEGFDEFFLQPAVDRAYKEAKGEPMDEGRETS